jgi:hypothetical protein
VTVARELAQRLEAPARDPRDRMEPEEQVERVAGERGGGIAAADVRELVAERVEEPLLGTVRRQSARQEHDREAAKKPLSPIRKTWNEH